MKKQCFFIVSFFLLCCQLFSQEVLKSIEEEYYDFLSIQGLCDRPTINYRTLSDSQWKITEDNNENSEIISKHPWNELNFRKTHILWQSNKEHKDWFSKGINNSVILKIYGPEWFNSYNTSSPYGQNDGALWQGRGYNTSLSGGARIEAFGFEITVKPSMLFEQNLQFDMKTGSINPNGYFSTIDLVQRYGENFNFYFDFGDSEVRFTFFNFTIGFGTQNSWTGFSWLNPILGSNNSAGYPKLDMGFRKTSLYIPKINWYLGDVEFRIWSGCLTESSYFDNNPSNDKTLINALSFGYSPSFIPGLSLGINRVFLTSFNAYNIKYLYKLFMLNSGNDIFGEGEDQKCSFAFNYKFEKIGFEVFAEIGIDDFTSDVISNPFHTGIYTIGLKQIIPFRIDKISSEIIVECNNFEMSQDFQLQWEYAGFYSHGKIIKGYTNNGQIVGAGSGFFGNSQYLGYKVYYNKGFSTIFFHRHCPDNNYILNKAVKSDASYPSEISNNWYAKYWTYLDIGLDSCYFISKEFYISGNFTFSYIRNYLYTTNSSNFHLMLSAKYLL